MVHLARWHVLGQVEAVPNRSTRRRITVHVSLLRIRHGIVVANPRRENAARHMDEAAGGAAQQTVRDRIGFVGK